MTVETTIVRRRLSKLRGQHFGKKQSVADYVESHKSQERFRQKLRLIPANSLQMKYLFGEKQLH